MRLVNDLYYVCDHMHAYIENMLKGDISFIMQFTLKTFMHIQKDHTNQLGTFINSKACTPQDKTILN